MTTIGKFLNSSIAAMAGAAMAGAAVAALRAVVPQGRPEISSLFIL